MPKFREWSDEENELLREYARKNWKYQRRWEYHHARGFTDRTQDAIRNQTWKLKQSEDKNKWLDFERVGFLDIETSNLKANFGIMLSWCLKLENGKVLYDVIRRDEATDRSKLDKRILLSLIDTLETVDTVVTYNGTRFDIPYLRTRCIMQGIKTFPTYGEKRHIDLYYQVKAKLSLHRKSLDAACEAFNIVGKTPIDFQIWRDAKLGYKDALKKVLDHNKGDVVILEELFNIMLPFSKTTRRSL